MAFYEGFIQPIFALRRAVVYVLPEIRSVAEAFGVLRYGLRTTRRIVTLRARKSGRFAGEVPRCATAQSAQPRHPMMVHVPTPADTTGCPYRP